MKKLSSLVVGTVRLASGDRLSRTVVSRGGGWLTANISRVTKVHRVRVNEAQAAECGRSGLMSRCGTGSLNLTGVAGLLGRRRALGAREEAFKLATKAFAFLSRFSRHGQRFGSCCCLDGRNLWLDSTRLDWDFGTANFYVRRVAVSQP